jgi:aminopeptidase N
MGAHADWAALQAAFERASGADLQRFFDEWVHGEGAPGSRPESG